MRLDDILEARAISIGVSVGTKKQLLGLIADHAQKLYGLDYAICYQALKDREAESSTGLGHGVAVPHAILAQQKKIQALFFILSEPLNFDAVDERPVDLVFALMVPQHMEKEHLQTLAKISRLLRDKNLRQNLRKAQKQDVVFALLIDATQSYAA